MKQKVISEQILEDPQEIEVFHGDDLTAFSAHEVDALSRSGYYRMLGIAPQAALLITKLSPPSLRSDLISRPQLHQRLAEVVIHKLTLISAPAGFGKTTLLSQWKDCSGFPTAWLSLDDGDNDPARFWSHFVAAIQTIYHGISNQALTMLRNSEGEEAFLTALINIFSEGKDDFVLVLDDYQTIDTRAIHSAMMYLIEHLPPQLHVVIASRADPPIPLAGLRAKGQFGELRVADLSFSPEESTMFLQKVMGLELHDADVATLEKRTEGWISGLQLAALSLRQSKDVAGFIKGFDGHHRFILDYLVEEVLRQQPKHVCDFLMRTCILDRLCASLCEAVTGQDNGQAMLERLERANLFIVPLDNERRWYRYHPLFMDCLLATLRQTKLDKESELHRRASMWYASQGLPADGVKHALAAREFETAAELIEESALIMLRRNECMTLTKWMRTLPKELMWHRPKLCYYFGWALTGVQELDEAEAWIDEVERHLGGGTGDVTDWEITDSIDSNQSILANIVLLRATIASLRQDLSLTISLSNLALEHLFKNDSEERSLILRALGAAYYQSGQVVKASQMYAEAVNISRSMGDLLSTTTLLSHLAGLQALQGRLHDVAKNDLQALDLAVKQGVEEFPIAGRPCLGLAAVHYEWNDLAAAEHYVLKGIDLANREGLTDIILSGHGILARLKQAQGDIQAALDIIEQGEQLARANVFPQYVARLSAYRVRLWLSAGLTEPAFAWAEALGLNGSGELRFHDEAAYLSLSRVWMVQGKTDKALEILGRLLELAEQERRIGSVIKILTLRALVFQASGDRTKGTIDLGQAVVLGQRQGYIRSFVDHGSALIGMLATAREELKKGCNCSSSEDIENYVGQLMAAFRPIEQSKSVQLKPFDRRQGNEMTSLRPVQDAIWMPTEQLTDREREVLSFIATGASNKAIALRLVVAESTVKKHINSIYSKLDVQNRMQAVLRARAVGLLG